MNESSLFGPGAEAIWSTGKKRKRALPPHILGAGISGGHIAKLGEAEQLYIEGRLDEAVKVLSDIAKEVPRWPEPYTILALIYEALGQKHAALHLYILVATFQSKRKRSIEPWKKVAYYAYDLGEYSKAVYATLRCLKGEAIEQEVQDLHRLKIQSLIALSKIKASLTALKQHLVLYPNDKLINFDIAECLFNQGYPMSALKLYKQFLQRMDLHIEEDPSLLPSRPFNSVGSEIYLESVHVFVNSTTDQLLDCMDDVLQAIYRVCSIWMDAHNNALAVVDVVEICFSLHRIIYGNVAINSSPFPLELVVLLARAKLVMSMRVEGEEGDTTPALTLLDSAVPVLLSNDNAAGLAPRLGTCEGLRTLVQLLHGCGLMLQCGLTSRAVRLVDKVRAYFTANVMNGSSQIEEICKETQMDRKRDYFYHLAIVAVSIAEVTTQSPALAITPPQSAVYLQQRDMLLNECVESLRIVRMVLQRLQTFTKSATLTDPNQDAALGSSEGNDEGGYSDGRGEVEAVHRALAVAQHLQQLAEFSPHRQAICEVCLDLRSYGSLLLEQICKDFVRLQAATSSRGSNGNGGPAKDEKNVEDEIIDNDDDLQIDETDVPELPSATQSASLPVQGADDGTGELDDEAATQAMEALIHLSESHHAPTVQAATVAPIIIANPDAPPSVWTPPDVQFFPRVTVARHVLGNVYVLLLRWIRSCQWRSVQAVGEAQRVLAQKLIATFMQTYSSRRSTKEVVLIGEVLQACSREVCDDGAAGDVADSSNASDEARLLCRLFSVLARYAPIDIFSTLCGTGSYFAADLEREMMDMVQDEVDALRGCGDIAQSELLERYRMPLFAPADRPRGPAPTPAKSKPKSSSSSSNSTVWDYIHQALGLSTVEPEDEDIYAYLQTHLGDKKQGELQRPANQSRRLQHLLTHYLSSCSALGSPDAQRAAKVFLLDSGNISAINLLARALLPAKIEDSMSVLATCHVNNDPDLWIPHMLLGNEAAVFKRHGPVVDHYLQALHLLALRHCGGEAPVTKLETPADSSAQPHQPLLYLLTGTYLLMLATHPIMRQRQDLLLRAWAMLTLYVQSRLAGTADEDTALYVQEVFYNMGRACQDIRLDHLAVTYYRLGLHVHDSKRLGHRNLTPQCAHNLCIIYSQAGSKDVAFDVMAKYLVCDE